MTPEDTKALPTESIIQTISRWSDELTNTRDRTKKCHDLLDAAKSCGPDGTHNGLLHRIKLLIADRDNLQSKLTACEAKLKATEDQNHLFSIRDAEHLAELASLKQQLAAATAPVGMEELEKFVRENITPYVIPASRYELQDELFRLIRAARQRGKVSADAVKLAEMVKDYRNKGAIELTEKYKITESEQEYIYSALTKLMQPLADSILAQAVAEKSAAVDLLKADDREELATVREWESSRVPTEVVAGQKGKS